MKTPESNCLPAVPSAGPARRSQRGLSLIEIVVASALALVGFLVAMLVYQGARGLFKSGEQAADQQQAVRLGFDMMVRDMRLAGFNTNPDGSGARLDEQIEGAWAGAIVMRGDYDYEDTTGLSLDPESLIAGVFNSASTGNDEVIGYVLKKADNSGGTTLTLSADVTSSTTATSALYGSVAARDNVVESITIPNVHLTQTSPPYTLYRVSLSNTSTDYNTGSFVRLTPVAGNVKSLAIKYYNAAGTLITAPGGDETAAAINSRAAIRRIEPEIIGLTPDPDPSYVDLTDTLTATRNYRKFSLSADVTPRNAGKKGVADLDLTAPSTPTGLSTCSGHCQGMVVKWNPNPPADLVSQYTLRYGTNPSNLASTRTTSGTWAWLPTLSMSTYYFQLRAEDSYGNASPWTTSISGLVRDDVSPTLTTPIAVDQAGASVSGNGGLGAQNGRVYLAWANVVSNLETITCDPGGTTLCRDLKGYRLYKSTSSSAAPGTPIVDETVLTTNAYTDQAVVNCRNYFYYIGAVDLCSHVSTNWATSTQGRAESTDDPVPPVGLTASRTASTTARIGWSPVTADVNGVPILVDTYQVYRSILPTNGTDPNTSVYASIGTIAGQNFFDDTSAPTAASGLSPYYRITAMDDCPNESAQSDPVGLTCPFNGTVTISPSTGTSMTTAPTTITVTYSGPDTLTSAQMTVTKVGGGVDFTQTVAGSGPVYTFSWTPSQGVGSYTFSATMLNTAGCAQTSGGGWTLIAPVTCCLSVDTALTTFPGSGNKSKIIRFTLRNTGACSDDVDVTQMIQALSLDQNSCNGLPKLTKVVNFTNTTQVWANGSGTSLPATSNLSPVIRITNNGTKQIELEFDTEIQDKCNGPGGNITRRDRITSSITFSLVNSVGSASCGSVQLNNGAPTP